MDSRIAPTPNPSPEGEGLCVPRHELRALTGARGIAAWFVVLFHLHATIAGLPAPLASVFAKGYLAVDFFFLLSGFVLWLSWGDRLRTQGLAAVPGFLWRRLARIWPLHLFTLGATVLLALALAASGRHDAGHYPFADLPLHALLLHNWGFTDRLEWNDPSWSISCEWAAYLLFPLLAFALDWRRVPSWAVLVAIVLAFALLDQAMAAAPTLRDAVWHFGLRRCLIEFAVGGAICALWQRWGDAPVLPAVLAGLVALALLAAGLAGAPETLVAPAGFAALLLALALTCGWRGNPLETRALHALGEISYATYLGHFLLFVFFKLMMVDNVADLPPTLVVLYLALVLGSSIALHQLIELPAQAWMIRLRRRQALPRARLGSRG